MVQINCANLQYLSMYQTEGGSRKILKYFSLNGLKACIKSNKDVEYLSAKKRGKLALHFRKWRLDF